MIKVHIHPRGKGLNKPTKCKFIVPESMLFCHFVARIRNEYAKLEPNQAVFYFVGGTMPLMTASMGDLWKSCNCPEVVDIMYELENVFG